MSDTRASRWSNPRSFATRSRHDSQKTDGEHFDPAGWQSSIPAAEARSVNVAGEVRERLTDLARLGIA